MKTTKYLSKRIDHLEALLLKKKVIKATEIWK